MAILLICGAVELALQLADLRILDLPRLRTTAYEYGGFWPGLLRDWRPNFAGQPIAMFFSYSFLHGGIVHLGVNMITLVSLGALVDDRLGWLRYGALYVASILGGAIGYAILARGLVPMVGASGALFGLAGAILAWEARDRMRLKEAMGPVWRMIALLLALNLLFWWAMDGHLAWQTHLGGFIAGAIAALALDRSSPAQDT